MNTTALLSAISEQWDADIVPQLTNYVRVPAKSPHYDLPAYLDALAPRMGAVDFVIGLDCGCGDYERMWDTTSLRGLAGGVLRVEVLSEGVHSGDASGIVPSSFRIARKLLDRLEDATTGRVLPAEFHAARSEEHTSELQS